MKRRHLLAAGLSLPALSVPLVACGQSAVPAPATTPRTEGLHAALTAAAVEAARDLPKMRALIVARDGRPLIEEVLRGPGLDTAVNVKSASKSVLAAVAGAAIGKGLLTGVDQTVAPSCPTAFRPIPIHA